MKLPKKVEIRIDDAIQDHNIWCRHNGKLDEMFHYSRPVSSITSARVHHVYLDDNFPNSLVLTTWNEGQDWKRIYYRVNTNDIRFKRFVCDIVEVYVEEMYAYYSEIQ